MISKEQERAKQAWEFVTDAHNGLSGKFKDYKNLAKSAPALVVSNGLMQTLAFFKGKKDAQYKKLMDQVVKWVCEQVYGNQCKGFNALMQKMTEETDVSKYMLATEESLEILKWIRHFAPTMDK